MDKNHGPQTRGTGIWHFKNICTPLYVALIALAVYISFIAVLLPLTDGNLYGLYGFSKEEGHSPGGYGGAPWRAYAHPKPGYDGQYYFMLALDPLTREREVLGVRLDHPLRRQQRLLLPFITWFITQGNPRTIPMVMLGINLAAIAGCAFVGSLLLKEFNISPWYGLPFAFYPGLVVSAARYLTEPLALVLILAALLMLVKQKHLWASGCLSLSILARETATLVVAAGFVTWFLEKMSKDPTSDRLSPHASFWLYPALVFFLWQLWLFKHWSLTVFHSAGSSKIGIPLVGFILSVKDDVLHVNPETGYYLLLTSGVVAFHLFLLRQIRKFPRLLRNAWIFYLLLAACAGTAIWSNSVGFLRILTELNALALLGYFLVKKPPNTYVVAAWLLAWVLSAGAEWYHLFLVHQTF